MAFRSEVISASDPFRRLRAFIPVVLPEENPAGDRVVRPGIGDGDLDVAGEIPREPLPVGEVADAAGVQHIAGQGIGDLNRFAATEVIPIQQVERHPMAQAIGQVEVQGEAGGGKVAGGDSIARAGAGLKAA